MERTEKATPKKRRDTRERGRVAQSRDLSSALALTGCIAALYMFYPLIVEALTGSMTRAITQRIEDDMFTVSGIQRVLLSSALSFIKAAAPPVVAAAVVGAFAGYLQVGFLFASKPFQPDFNRLSPIEGFKRIFSKNALVQLVKSLIKVAVVGYLLFSYTMTRYSGIGRLLDMDIGQISHFSGMAVIKLSLRAAGALITLAALDYIYQIYEFNRSIMMTKQELREEYKQLEGDPRVKSKIRERQRLISARRMMADVPKADVVITNPTHLAVAIKYDPEIAQAPYVLAKGKGLIAQKIKSIAIENDVMVVENKGLARSLYERADIGDLIPAELYQAVAEVLAFVYSLDKERL
jgi:flagellar biosynthetic protein FlhB